MLTFRIYVAALVVAACFITKTEGWLFSSLWDSRVCYDNIGCFSTDYPYNITSSRTPDSPADIDIKYIMVGGGRTSTFSFSNIDQALQLYSPDRRTVALVHGWQEGPQGWPTHFMNALLATDPNMNIICVDWTDGAADMIYSQSVANTRVVGAELARLIQLLVSQGGSLSDMHIIGFSLGGHVAGFTGERLPGLARITGLDPAGPNFRDTPPAARLDAGDAELVDVYHTDAHSFTGLGIAQPVGDVDFYLNGGVNQPGCDRGVMGTLQELWRTRLRSNRALRNSAGCAHFRAVTYFMSTLQSTCSNRNPMTSCSPRTSGESSPLLQTANRVIGHRHVSWLQRRLSSRPRWAQRILGQAVPLVGNIHAAEDTSVVGSCSTCGDSCPTPGFNVQLPDRRLSGSGDGRRVYNIETSGTAPFC